MVVTTLPRLSRSKFCARSGRKSASRPPDCHPARANLDPLRLKVLPRTLPLDNAIRIELSEGVPVFRASPHVQERVEHLLEKQRESALTPEESRELLQYEELDDLLSLGSRVMRNLTKSQS